MSEITTMKMWFISLGLSVVLCGIGLAYFLYFIAQDTCLDSGGRWLGIIAGCEGGRDLELDFLISPLLIALFLGIVLGVCSAFVQFYALISRRQN